MTDILKKKGSKEAYFLTEILKHLVEARRKELRKQGMGKKENAAEPISKTEENQLWESKQLGDSNSYALLQTVWYFNTMQFGWRGCDEHCHVCLGDFKVCTDSDGIDYVEFNTERQGKVLNGK